MSRRLSRFAVLAGALTLAAGAAPAATQPAPTPPPVRTLFVGVDHYTHAYPGDPHADKSLHDLEGATGDVRLIKATLAAAPYALPVDDSPACQAGVWTRPTRTPMSITLLDGCATRAAILQALLAQIDASPVNGIVLFYFAGHGSSHVQTVQTGNQQLTGRNSTIVPADAWRDPDEPDNDILDVELRAVIDAAAGRGVSVVTIFDSCHSQTATRDVDGAFKVNDHARAAAPTTKPIPAGNAAWLRARIDDLQRPAPSTQIPNPYRVHMAAAGDNEDAQEVWCDANDKCGGAPPADPAAAKGQWHGAFTLALVDTLKNRRGATYLEIADQAYIALQRFGTGESIAPTGPPCGATSVSICDPLASARSAARQTGHAEGPLETAFLGRADDRLSGYVAAAAADGTLTLSAGAAELVTAGSTFAIHAYPRTDPVVATGAIFDLADNQAKIKLDPPAALTPGATYWAEETWHNFGDQRLRVEIVGGDPAARTQVIGQMAKLTGPQGYVSLVGPGTDSPDGVPQFRISLSGDQAEFQDANGRKILSAGVICRSGASQTTCDPDFPRRLAMVTRAAANYFALLTLGDHTPTRHGSAHWGEIDVFPGGCPNDGDCSQQTPSDAEVVPISLSQTKGNVDIYITNTSCPDAATTCGGKHRYMLLLSPDDFSVTVLSPPGYSDDPPLVTSTDYQGVFARPGKAILLVLLTDNPINLEALHQDPVRDATVTNGLERLLLFAGRGQRDTGPPPGDFDVVTRKIEVTR